MHRRRVAPVAIAVAVLWLGSGQLDAAEKNLNEQIVDALNAVFGAHPGFRAAHAKGQVCEGVFQPSKSAADFCSAVHFTKKEVPITVRFSNGSGVPDAPDGAAISSPHGFAIRFHLPGGGVTDIVANAANGFVVGKPEEFLAFLKAVAASGPSVPSPKPIEAYFKEHPKAAKFATAPKPTPSSFASEPYFGVNAFKFTNAEGKSRFGRYQLRPEEKLAHLDVADAAKRPANFLFDELTARLDKQPIVFHLVVQIASPTDPLDDASIVWPDDRETVDLGVLRITKVVPDNAAAQARLAFSPLRLTDGIEASNDPLLDTRAETYAISARRRRK